MSVKFVSAILGPEMAAPILWAPGKMFRFCRKTNVHKIPRFGGGGVFWVGGGSADFIIIGAGIFLIDLGYFGTWPIPSRLSLLLQKPRTPEGFLKGL